METSDDLFKELEHLTHHVANIQKLLILQGHSSKSREAKSPADLTRLVQEITAKWSGPGAVEEIRQQREKTT